MSLKSAAASQVTNKPSITSSVAGASVSGLLRLNLRGRRSG